MTRTSLQSFVDLLRECRFLGVEQLSEVTEHLLSRCTDARSLARALMRRGWLTVYQTNRLFSSGVADLVWGDYQILDRLGEGGNGRVHKARHIPTGRLVALKTLSGELETRPEVVAQFEWESSVLARLSHPNVVKFIEAGRVKGRPFCATEYLAGYDLGKTVRLSGGLPIGRACECARQAALALQAAHEVGLVHRDVKPANLFLVEAESEERLKLIDWGLACWQDPDHPEQRHCPPAPEGALLGTADYLAPEQIRNPTAVDIRADVYSLGCTLYHLLAGQPPYPSPSLMQKLLRHQNDPPPPLSQARPEVPGEVAALVEKMLAKQPEERFETPSQVAELLTPHCQPRE
jgi:eukaryotic-like serine/threonine-protein kinase